MAENTYCTYRGNRAALAAMLMLVAACGCAAPAQRAFEAAWAGDGASVRGLLKSHPDLVWAFSEGGQTLLHVALVTGQDDLALLLVEQGASVTCSDGEGAMPVHLAPSANVVRRLLAAGASAEARDAEGRTPLHLARSAEAVDVLLAAGADPTAKDRWGNTPLVGAAASGDVAAVARLLSAGADAESLDRALLAAGLAEFRARDEVRSAACGAAAAERASADARLAACRAVVEPLHAARQTVAATSSVFRRPGAAGPFRMVSPLRVGQAYPLFSAVWKHEDGERLVCLQYAGGELFGTTYEVAVFDSSLRLTRCGLLTVPQDDQPFALIEVRTAGGSVPPAQRGQWLLGVVTWNPACGFDERWPCALVNREVSGEAKVNGLDATLVEWWDDESPAVRRIDAIKEPVEVRWGEPGPSLLEPVPR